MRAETSKAHEPEAFEKKPSESRNKLGSSHVRKWVAYLTKSLALTAVLFITSRLAPTMPTLAVAVAWALLSAIASVGISYLAVVRRTYNQLKYRKGGYRARWNEGRLLTLLLSFIATAALMASLFFEMTAWGFTEWLLVTIAAILFIPLAVIFDQIEKREWEELFHTSVVAKKSARHVFHSPP